MSFLNGKCRNVFCFYTYILNEIRAIIYLLANFFTQLFYFKEYKYKN